MNKKVNLIFSIIGLATEVFYLVNSLNIWIHHITINFADIVDSLFDILIVVVGLVLTIISILSHKENYKIANVINYVSIVILILATFLLKCWQNS